MLETYCIIFYMVVILAFLASLWRGSDYDED